MFFRTVNQLKNTSDCIKIDPPGPGRNLKKNSQKNRKKSVQKFGRFWGVWVFFANQIFYKQKRGFFGWWRCRRRFFCEKKGPKFWRKFWTFFGQNVGPFFWLLFGKKHSKCFETYLVRQISSRGSGSNFFYPKLIGNR